MTGLLIWAAIGLSLLLFGLWMGFSARTGPQSTLGSAFVLFATILLLAVFWMAVPAHAHDHARPELDGWYASLRNKHGIPCCDGSDATRVEDADWEAKERSLPRPSGKSVGGRPGRSRDRDAEQGWPHAGMALSHQRPARGSVLHAGIYDVRKIAVIIALALCLWPGIPWLRFYAPYVARHFGF